MISENILDCKSLQSDVCVLSYDLEKQLYILALTPTTEDEGKCFMYM